MSGNTRSTLRKMLILRQSSANIAQAPHGGGIRKVLIYNKS